MKPDIIIICGPTGIGKTSLTISLAKEFNGQIISADSMQIYKYMDIGTAKPTPSEIAEVKHHIVDFVDPDVPFDAAKFAAMADEKINEFSKTGITPFIAGGTGLYIKSLVDGLFRARPADSEILKRLSSEASENGSDLLFERLKTCDAKSAEKIHPNDVFRIIRALEVFESTGMPISSYHKKHNFAESRYRTLKICLSMDREALYERINKRVDEMLDEGLLNEVNELLDKGYSPDLKSMRSLGYRHMIEFLNGENDWDETVRILKRDTRRYAKRQLTWFRADDEIVWVPKENINEIRKLIKKFLQKTN